MEPCASVVARYAIRPEADHREAHGDLKRGLVGMFTGGEVSVPTMPTSRDVGSHPRPPSCARRFRSGMARYVISN